MDPVGVDVWLTIATHRVMLLHFRSVVAGMSDVRKRIESVAEVAALAELKVRAARIHSHVAPAVYTRSHVL